VLIELGSAYDLKGDDRRALGYLEQARALEPENRAVVATLASVQHGRGHRLAEAGRRDEAAAAFEAAVELVSDEPEHWECLGGAYLRLNRPDAAGSAFRRARAAAPKDPAVRVSIGREYLAVGDDKEADKHFREALRLDRGPFTRTAIGLTCLRQSRVALAAPYLEPALKQNTPLPLMLIGKLLIDTHHAAEAIPYLERAASLAPWEVDVRINLAYARAFGQREYDRAASELSVAEELAKVQGDRAALSIIADARDALQLLWEAEQRPGGLAQVVGLLDPGGR
jgi:tetratricopeptide (TPR) repeat protein